MHILDKIVIHKKQEVKIRKESKALNDLKQSQHFDRETNSLLSVLNKNNGPAIIAEFKRKSPSKQAINLDADLHNVTSGYASG